MAEMTGNVHCLRIGNDYAFTAISTSIASPVVGSGAGIAGPLRRTEFFTLWFFPTELSSYTRIMHSMWVSVLRDARSNNLEVTISYEDSSSRVLAVQSGTI